MKTVHLIFNAHLDPVWLWPWHAGVTEALATARNACDMLDECDDLIFSRGESWFYEQIQRHDPQTFERIRKHIASGRWEIVGGWYLQPDCNQPGRIGFEKQIELGQCYFQKTFQHFPDIGYNVDSFGHNASLPGMMHKAGQRYYVMMRPQEHEMNLPARLFRWRGYEGGPEIITFRIAAAYTTPFGITADHVRASLTGLPEGVDHTMCFVGLGDHGGGPSREMVQWCRDHADDFPGAKLIFSSPSQFFAAIAKQASSLPLVTGELQQHAVGCYGIARQLKTQLRKAECNLERIEHALPELKNDSAIDRAWRSVCFHQFHDTLGGTCLPSAYDFVRADVGGACAQAEEILRRHVIDIAQALPSDKRQRMVIWNPGPNRFKGFVEYEPWLEWTKWTPNRQIKDVNGNIIPYQILASEALVTNMTRLLFPCELEPGQVFVASFDPWQEESSALPAVANDVHADQNDIYNHKNTFISPKKSEWKIDGIPIHRPELALIPDPTDTWSHGIDRYAKSGVMTAEIHESRMVDSGPLMASFIERGTIGQSRFEAEWRVYAGESAVHLHLHVEWIERHHVLKLLWPLPVECLYREDGIPGGILRRDPDGRELPLRDLTCIHLADGRTLGVACPDVFALDGDGKHIRFTLLRSPAMAHHDPASSQAPRRQFSDRGEHEFHFVFTAGDGANVDTLELLASQFWMPPLVTDLTRGMPKRLMRTPL